MADELVTLGRTRPMGQHWITITAGTEDSDPDYELECDGVDAHCRLWQECMECSPTEDDFDDGEYERHGQFHQVIDSCGMTETNRCIVLALAPQGDGPNTILFSGGPGGGEMPAGRYPIGFDYEGDSEVWVGLEREKFEMPAVA